MTEIIDICGVLVLAKKENIDDVRHQLKIIDGVEVHATSKDQKIVVTVERNDGGKVADIIHTFHDIKGVLSASVIYQHAEEL